MTPGPAGARSTCLVLAWIGLAAACGGDQVQAGSYGGVDDAGADARGAVGVSPSGDGSSCDMSGRWLVAQRVLADAIGQKQASHNWFYYEISESAGQVTVTKGLQCGFEVVPVTSLGANVDSQPAWAGILTHVSDTGRKGTMGVSASGCQLAIEKKYTVRGATVSFYSDPNQTMPTASQQAAGSTPGWEDWDMDGNPGITLVVSEGGSNLGNLYCAQRDWNQFAGTVASTSTSFKVPVTWGSEQDALGYTGSSLVTQSATPDTDAAQNFAWFARLGPGQATGDDTAICAAVRSLVPTLAPGAMN